MYLVYVPSELIICGSIRLESASVFWKLSGFRIEHSKSTINKKDEARESWITYHRCHVARQWGAPLGTVVSRKCGTSVHFRYLRLNFNFSCPDCCYYSIHSHWTISGKVPTCQKDSRIEPQSRNFLLSSRPLVNSKCRVRRLCSPYHWLCPILGCKIAPSRSCH